MDPISSMDASTDFHGEMFLSKPIEFTDYLKRVNRLSLPEKADQLFQCLEVLNKASDIADGKFVRSDKATNAISVFE